MVTFVVVYEVNRLGEKIETIYDSQEDFQRAGDPGSYRSWDFITVVDRSAQQEWISAKKRYLGAYPGCVREVNMGGRESLNRSIVENTARLMKELEAAAKEGNE